ncbi:MAG: radical SAM protein [Tannerellaceae bacterium]|jgi:uncharacterized protein|nr:radical SAM protein [Tannerellaceae bacterium]
METRVPLFEPHTLMIVPSMGCMAECKYCFGPHKGSVMKRPVMDAIARFAGDLWENKRERKIIFHGGEPLIAGYDWFAYALEALTEVLHHRVRFSIQSNLWLLDQPLVDLFAHYQVSLSTSLDGPRELCDSQRGTGYFDKTMAGLRLLRENGLSIGAIATVMPAHIDQIPEIFRFFEREQISFSLRGAVPSLSHGYQARDCYVTSAEAEAIYFRALEYMEQHPTTIQVKDVTSPVRNVFSGKSSLCTFSNCLGHYVAVDPAANLYTCQRFCGASEYAIGNLLDGKLFDGKPAEAIASHPNYRRIAAKYSQTQTACGDCKHLNYCHGGCVYSMLVAEKYKQPLPFCNDQEPSGRLYKKLFDEISFKLAQEEAAVMLGEDSPTPYLVMAGDKQHPAETARSKQRFLHYYKWGKTGAPRHAFAGSQLVDNLYLNITNNCPLRCSHCSVEATKGFQDMPIETVLSLVREAIAIGYRELSLNGGEPFVYQQFPELLERLGEIPHPTMRLALFTNLYCEMDDAMAEKVLSVFNHITVSLDGDEEEHDRRRGKGTFARTCANLRRLQAIPSKCKLALRASLTAEQRRRGVAEQVQSVGQQLGIRQVYITNVFPLGRAKTLDSVYELSPPKADPSRFKTLQGRNTCGIGNNLHITSEGDIYPCWAFLKDGQPLGHIRDGLRQATQAYRWGKHPYTVDQSEKCKACDVRYLCGGICRAYKDTDCSALRASFLEMLALAQQAI